MKKHKLGIIGATLAALSMGVAPMSSPVIIHPGSTQATTNRDAIKEDIKPVRSVTQKKKKQLWAGDIKHTGTAGLFKNQRQYRKHCRQNPSLYKSRKHRSKN